MLCFIRMNTDAGFCKYLLLSPVKFCNNKVSNHIHYHFPMMFPDTVLSYKKTLKTIFI